jgi:hypothetical protein
MTTRLILGGKPAQFIANWEEWYKRCGGGRSVRRGVVVEGVL